MTCPRFAFELKKRRLRMTSILPVRQVNENEKRLRRYRRIRDSIKAIGLIEPLVVFPHKRKKGEYYLNDGHRRHAVLKDLGAKSVDCIIATDDERFSYNAQISKITLPRETETILNAVHNGVKPEMIAHAFNRSVRQIKESMNLLNGLDERAVELIKNKNVTPKMIRILKKVKPARQVQMVKLMLTVNKLEGVFAEVLMLSTPKDLLANPDTPKRKYGVSAKLIARMEREMRTLEHDLNEIKGNYGANVLTLTLARGYIKRLLENAKIVRFLNRNYREILTEFEDIAATESL